MLFSPFLFLFVVRALAQSGSSSQPASSAASSSVSATPSCLQPRNSPTPSASAISTVLTSAVPNACNINTQKTSTNGLLDVIYYQVDSFFFNISHSTLAVSQPNVSPSLCPDTFNSIITGCINAQGSGFWGGWISGDGTNYSITNFGYPQNGLLSASSSAAPLSGLSTATGGTGGGPSGSSNAPSQSQVPSSSISNAASQGSTLKISSTVPGSASNPAGSSQSGSVPQGSSTSPTSVGSLTTSASPRSSSGSVPVSGPSSSGSSTLGNGVSSSGSSTPGNGVSSSGASAPLNGPSSSGSSALGVRSSTSSAQSPSSVAGGSSTHPASEGSVSSSTAGVPPTASVSSQNSGTSSRPSNTGSSGTLASSPQPGPGSTQSGASSAGSSPASSGPGTRSNGGSTSVGSAPVPVITPSGSGIDEQYSLAPGVTASGNPTDLVVGGETLLPGGPPFTDASNTISLETGGFVAVNGNTERLLAPTAPTGPSPVSGSSSASSQRSSSSNGNPTSSGGASQGGSTTPGNSPSTTASASSINVGLITGTLTSAPTDFSTQSTSNPAWTGNTWITTQQDGHTTIVPVIVGCPNCGGIHGGIILWNLPELPSLSFQFPGFPNLPHFHLPCIKIFGVAVSGDCSSPPEDDNPADEDPDSTESNPSSTETSETSTTATSTPSSVSASTTSSRSSSSSSGCPSSATKVASDCSVLCGATGTSQSCSTTCFSTITGCSATGMTVTSSASVSVPSCYSLLPGASGASALGKRAVSGASASDGCSLACPTSRPPIPTSGPLAISLPSTDPADYEKRALAGRTYHVLAKRKTAVTIVTINGCNLATPVGSPVTTPSYPGGFEFWASETNGVLPASYQAISRYYRTTPSGCVPTVTKVPANQLNPVQNSGDNNNENSIDHAYENGWLTSFMESIVNNGGSSLTCNQLNGIFFTASCNFLEPIFGALASAINPDFVAMSQYLNGDAKGYILGSGYQTPPDLQAQYVVQSTWSWADSYNNIWAKLGTVELMMMGCLTVQAPNLIDMIQKTNNRIYAWFLFIDNSLASDPSVPRYNFGFAQQYKDYMNNFANQWNGVPTYVTQLVQSIGRDLQTSRTMPDVVNSEWLSCYTLYANWLSEYEYSNTQAWKYSINLAFDTTNTKRDLEIFARAAPACPFPSGGTEPSVIPSFVRSGSAAVSGSNTASSGVSSTGSGTITSKATTAPASSSKTQSGTSTSETICPNNAVDENPPNCVQPSSSSQPFSCSAGSNVGLATYNPATWCGCNTGTGIYPTLTTGTGNAACAYTTLPSTTVNPTVVSATICPNNAVDENPPNCVQPSSTSQPFSCSAGSNVGLATYNPATWCGCNTGTGIYPTLTSGTGNAACAYTALPSSTVNPTIVSATTTAAAFSCTTIANPIDSDFPCSCSDGRTYCANNGACNWTSTPTAENCCEDCE